MVFSMMKQVPDGEGSSENKSRAHDPCTLPWCKLVKNDALEAIAAMTHIRVSDIFACKPEECEPQGTCHMTHPALGSNPVLSMFTPRGRVSFTNEINDLTRQVQ